VLWHMSSVYRCVDHAKLDARWKFGVPVRMFGLEDGISNLAHGNMGGTI